MQDINTLVNSASPALEQIKTHQQLAQEERHRQGVELDRESIRQIEQRNNLNNQLADFYIQRGQLGRLIERARDAMKRSLQQIEEHTVELAKHEIRRQFAKRIGRPAAADARNSQEQEELWRLEKLPAEIERHWRCISKANHDVSVHLSAVARLDDEIKSFRAKHHL